MEMRHGKPKPVIKKALVDLQAKAFLQLKEHRERWAREDLYLCPGPLQFEGNSEDINKGPVSILIS